MSESETIEIDKEALQDEIKKLERCLDIHDDGSRAWDKCMVARNTYELILHEKHIHTE